MDKTKILASQTAMIVALRGVLFPNTVIKTHIQTNAMDGRAYGVARSIVQRKGVRGLWKGFMVSQCGRVPAHLSYVLGLEYTKHAATSAIQGLGVSTSKANEMGSFVGGGIAAFIQQLVNTPADVISSRIMLQGSPGAAAEYHGGFHAFRTILASDGVRGLYAGLGPSLMGAVPFSAVFWSSYALLKRHLVPIFSSLEVAQSSRFASEPEVSLTYGPPAFAQDSAPFASSELMAFSTAAFCSVVLAAAVTNPLDVVKTRMQTKAKTGSTAHGGLLAQHGAGIFSHLRNIVRFEGWASLSKGFASQVMTHGPFAVIGILMYESSKEYSRKV